MKPSTPKPPKSRRSTHDDKATPQTGPEYLVGIGASAGGLEALRPLIRGLRPTGKAAYLVAQHRSHDHPSLLTKLLAEGAALAVTTAEDGQAVKPDHVYTIPVGKNLEVRGGRMALLEPDAGAVPVPSIDLLFASLADDAKARAVGVLLSGTGHDGTHGGQAIKAAGGWLLAQYPASAQQSGMVESALAVGVVDQMMGPEALADWLNALPPAGPVPEGGIHRGVEHDAFLELLGQVAQATQLDFTRYKEPTLWRQIERRVATLRLSSIGDYLRFVRSKPEELNILQQSFLISVTSFFRDPDIFGTLRQALRGLIDAKQGRDSLRAWVPGCATGEEAYSIAMVLAEILGERLAGFDVRVFGTDISRHAIDIARAALYPASALLGLDAPLAERHFTREGSAARIDKTVRDLCVFAVHDLARQPPFIHMDLISCRNVLIYFQPGPQHELLARFHYALNPGGLLLLGKSESVGVVTSLFEPADAKHRLYRRRAVPTPRVFPLGRGTMPGVPPGTPPSGRAMRIGPSAEAALREHLLAQYAPASVLASADLQPLHFFGDAGRYLALPKGAADFSVLLLCAPELRDEIRTLHHILKRAGNGGEPVRGQPVPLVLDGQALRVRVALSRFGHGPDGGSGAILISFEEEPVPAPPPTEGDAATREAVPDEAAELRLELRGTRAQMHSVIEALESSNEELQSLNEEFQATTEELQASNEELRVSNHELIAKTDELAMANETLSNIQDSVQAGLVVVDEQGRVRRFNELAVRVFNLLPRDIGQALAGVPCSVDLPDLRGQIEGVIGGGETLVQRASGGERHFLMQIAPYINGHGHRQGAVLSFTDISEMYRAETERKEAEERFRLFMDHSPTIAWVKDEAGRYAYLSKTFEDRFRVRLDDFRGKADSELWPRAVAETFRANDLAVLASGQPREFDEEAHAEDGGRRVWHVCKFPFRDAAGRRYVGGIGIDVTERRQMEEALVLRGSALDAAANAIVITDPEGRIEWANPAFMALSGYAREEAVGHTLRELVCSGRQDPAFYRRLWQTITSGQVWQGELVNRRKDGSRYYEYQTITPVRGDDGVAHHYVAIKQDISERRDAEDQMRLAAQVFKHCGDGVLVVDPDATVLTANGAFSRICGYALEELVGKPAALLKSGEHPPEFYEDLWTRLEQDGEWQGEIRTRRKDGTPYDGDLSISGVRNGEGKPAYYVGIVRDITGVKESHDRIEFLASHDGLTRLPNRVLFEDRLRHALRRLEREEDEGIAVLFIDLDNFKNVNDTLGHEAGDALLREVATRFQTCLREGDTLARQGGDEFGVLLESCDRYRASLVADRILQVLADPIDLGGHPTVISPSIGICMAPEDGRDEQTLLKNADAAMYRVKSSGRNGFQFFAQEMAVRAQRRMRIENGLHRALANGELALCYQPQFDLATGRMVAAEALIQWVRGRDTLPPDEFIPIAEESSLILKIGEWVLNAACAQLAEWRRRGLEPPLVWVNLSGKHIVRATLADELSRLLERHAIPPGALGIEITENSLIAGDDEILSMLLAIRAMGVGISIDDFGTGYSSLSYLKRYPIAELKIDKSFVDGIADEVDDDAIATAIIQMAHTLGMSVVAEGVETAEQLAALKAKGCNLAQGYYLGRPMSPDDAIAQMPPRETA